MAHNPDKKTEQAADLLGLLAHPVRIRIVLLLAEQASLNVSTLASLLAVDQSPVSISQHLIKMKDKGILVSVRQGQEVFYSLTDSIFGDVVKLLLSAEGK